KTLVAPSCTPTVADDEAAVGGISDTADAMAAANRRRHEGVELALGRGRVVPGMVDIERYLDRAIACQPRPPARQIALHVDLGGDLPRRRRGVEYVLVVVILVGLDMEGQQPLRHRAVVG